MEQNRINQKAKWSFQKVAGPNSNTKLPAHFIRKAVFLLGAVVYQHLPEGYIVGLKVEQGTYVLYHHRLESLMRIPSPLFDRPYAFPPAGD